MLWKSFTIGSGSSRRRRPALACRKSSIITGTFMVLAAWNTLSGSIVTAPRPFRGISTSPDLGAGWAWSR
jgi:hypothetical protein